MGNGGGGMTGYSTRHDEWYRQMIGEMLKFANMTEAQRVRLKRMSDSTGLYRAEANLVDELYQKYADQQVME